MTRYQAYFIQLAVTFLLVRECDTAGSAILIVGGVTLIAVGFVLLDNWMDRKKEKAP
jgi:hypothetical protein